MIKISISSPIPHLLVKPVVKHRPAHPCLYLPPSLPGDSTLTKLIILSAWSLSSTHCFIPRKGLYILALFSWFCSGVSGWQQFSSFSELKRGAFLPYLVSEDCFMRWFYLSVVFRTSRLSKEEQFMRRSHTKCRGFKTNASNKGQAGVCKLFCKGTDSKYLKL